MVYGRISFAILEDRKFKTGCGDRVASPGSSRADHITDPDFDVGRADLPGAKLLGDRQLRFLHHWAADWRHADMKVALSQTVFANVATHHGPELAYLRADLDSNGWPQTARNRALDALRRGFAFHLAGDQHLATIVHHGIDDWDDACWSFTVPSVANFYPRAWSPGNAGPYEYPAADEYTGTFKDGLDNFITVYAATNPGKDMGHTPGDLHNKMPGYGIVKLNKSQRTITMECWPRFADPEDSSSLQYDGWPKTIDQQQNYGRPAAAYLPEIDVRGVTNPVIQVVDPSRGEIVYTLRIRGTRFRPKVFAPGTYSVHVSQPDLGIMRTIRNIQCVDADSSDALVVQFD
jgi:hypothetical protein